jgi:hypothetical protein
MLAQRFERSENPGAATNDSLKPQSGQVLTNFGQTCYTLPARECVWAP